MRARYLSFVRALTVIGCVAAMPCLTGAATPRTLSMFVSDRLTSDGSVQFSLRAVGYSFPGGPIEGLIAPDGSVIPTDPFDDVSTFGSLDDMNALLFGRWEYRIAPSSDPTNFESYWFTITPFGSDDITVERPRILEPRRQYVGTSFQIVWDPPSENYAIGAGGLFMDNELVQPGVMDIDVRHIISRPNEGYVRFSTSKGQSLLSYVSSVTPPSATPTYDLTVKFAYSRAIEKTFYPRTVPEPMAITLALMLLGCAVFARRTR